MPLYDHAATRLYQLVREAADPVPVAWGRYPGEITYPWCSLQIVTGPNTMRQDRQVITLLSVDITVNAGSPGDLVAARLGGRYVAVAHTGDPSTTASALSDEFPSEWSVSAGGSTVSVNGPGLYVAEALHGCTIVTSDMGDPHLVNLLSRAATVQCDVWVRLDDTNRPEPWASNGSHAIAGRIRDALYNEIPEQPWHVQIDPMSDIRPFSESYPDGQNYSRASFDSWLRWIDYVAVERQGVATGVVTRAEGELTTSDGVVETIDDFAVEWSEP